MLVKRPPNLKTRPYADECVAFSVISQILTYPFRTVRGPTFFKDVHNSAIRSMLEHLTIADSRLLSPSTSERYLRLYCKSRNIKPNTLDLDTKQGRVVAHWIGDPDAEAVIMYCHGGGYTQPANEGNFRHLDRLVEDLKNQGGSLSVAVLMLAYTLVPEAVYPTQLREAAIVLAHLVQDTGRSPSNIFIAGDSAGGNLCLSLL